MNLKTAVEDIARHAGALALSYQQSDANVQLKPEAGNSPVTAIDLAVDAYLKEALTALDSTIGWLSEETVDDPIRLDQNRVWVVDPIDGTRALLRYLEEGLPMMDDPRFKRRQFSISIALVEENQPILGVIYAPLTEQLFSAAQGQGFTVNGQPVATLPMPVNLAGCTLLTSVSETKAGMVDELAAAMDTESYGSAAYKMALVSAGVGDLFASLRPKSEWDIAAGTLMAREMGLMVTDLVGQEFTFNQANTERNGVIVAPKSLYQEFKALLPTIAKSY